MQQQHGHDMDVKLAGKLSGIESNCAAVLHSGKSKLVAALSSGRLKLAAA
jgi:hypothetical protein